MLFADQAVLVEKFEIVGSFQSGPPGERSSSRVFGNLAGASFEQGGVDTSVYRAFLLFEGRLPIYQAQAVKHGACAETSQRHRPEAG